MIKIIINYLSFVCIAFLVFSGCENLNNPGKLQNNCSVLFNLRVHSSSQRLYIYNVTDASAQGSFQNYFIKNALAELKDFSNSVTSLLVKTDSTFNTNFKKYDFTSYYTNPTAFEALPLTNYFLSIKIDDRIITGKTTTPGDFNIVKPLAGDTITDNDYYYKINVAWERSKNAKGYFIRYFFPSENNNKNDFLNSDNMGYETSNDTTFQIQQYSYGILKDTCIIQVYAYDDNYYQQRYNKKAASGVNNAYGCFYSTLIKELKIVIR